MSDPVTDHEPLGVHSLPRDLTSAEIAAAPVLESLDVLEIDDLTDAEAEAFFDALGL